MNRKKRRTVFEEDWACSRQCLEKLVRAAIRRMGPEQATYYEAAPHRHRVPLGLVLLAQRWITHPQLQAALEQQRSGDASRIGDLLVRNCGMAPDRITRGLAMQWSCPVLSLDRFEPERMALTMPPQLCAELGVVPLRIAGADLLYLASSGEQDPALALLLEQMTGLRVESGLLSDAEMTTATERLLAQSSVAQKQHTAADADDLAVKVAGLMEHRQPVVARMGRVRGQFWLRLWLERGAFSAAGRVPRSPEDVEDHLFRLGSRNLAA